MAKPQETVSGWNFQNKHVQSNVDPGGSFIRGASVLLAAGPPTLELATAGKTDSSLFTGTSATNTGIFAKAHPIGLVENISIGQSKNLQNVFEIGSDRRYFIPGRTVNQMSLNRVMFDGPSLMKVLYNYYQPAEEHHNVDLYKFPTGSKTSGTATVKNQPGYDQTFLNLASELFNRPIGLLMLINNLQNNTVAATYFEYVFFRGHQFNISASSTLVSESIQAEFDHMVPLNMNYKGTNQP